MTTPWKWHSLCGPMDPDYVADCTFKERFVQDDDEEERRREDYEEEMNEFMRKEMEDDEYFSD